MGNFYHRPLMSGDGIFSHQLLKVWDLLEFSKRIYLIFRGGLVTHRDTERLAVFLSVQRPKVTGCFGFGWLVIPMTPCHHLQQWDNPARVQVSLISPCSRTQVCGPSNSRLLPSSSRGWPGIIAIVYNVWGFMVPQQV